MRQKKDLPQFSCILHLFKYVVIIVSLRLMSTLYFCIYIIFLDTTYKYFPTQNSVLWPFKLCLIIILDSTVIYNFIDQRFASVNKIEYKTV